MKTLRITKSKIFKTLYFICILIATPLLADENIEYGFLKKSDFRISSDSLAKGYLDLQSQIVKTDFDFSASGDTGTNRYSSGNVFATSWKKKCTDEERCDFLLTVLLNGVDSTNFGYPILHARITDSDSNTKSTVGLKTQFIESNSLTKLESSLNISILDSTIEPITNRRKDEFWLPKNQLGFELKLSISASLGKQSLSLYCRPINGHFKFPMAKIKLPKNFSPDSITFFATDSSGKSQITLSDAFAGSGTWNYVTEHESGYLKKLAKGDFPGGAANFDYFGEAIFKLIKSGNDTDGVFGSWGDYKAKVISMMNASEGGYLCPIQIIRTEFHEKNSKGAMVSTPFSLCTTPRRDIPANAAYLYVDPGFIYGDAGIREIWINDGKIKKSLAIGEKMTLDFTQQKEKSLTIGVAYHDGFQTIQPITIRGTKSL